MLDNYEDDNPSKTDCIPENTRAKSSKSNSGHGERFVLRLPPDLERSMSESKNSVMVNSPSSSQDEERGRSRERKSQDRSNSQRSSSESSGSQERKRQTRSESFESRHSLSESSDHSSSPSSPKIQYLHGEMNKNLRDALRVSYFYMYIYTFK